MRSYAVCAVLTATIVGCGEPVRLSPVQRVQSLYRADPVASWSSGRDEARLQREFSLYELHRLPDPEGKMALRWRFATRSESFGDAFFRKPIELNFRALRLRVNNTGPTLRFAVKLIDADGAEWTVEPTTLEGSGWRDLEWTRSDFHVAGWSKDPDGLLDLPTRALALIAFDLRAGWQYELWVEQVSAVQDVVVVPGLRVDVPKKVPADKALPLTVWFGGPPQAAPWWMDVSHEGRQVIRRKLGMLTSGRTVNVALEPYMPGGRYDVTLSLGDMPVLGKPDGPPASATMEIESRHAKADDTVAEVRAFDGVPTLQINGNPNSCMVYMTYHPNPLYFGQFGRAGVRLFSFSSTPTASEYGLSPTTWVAPDRFDYGNLDERARMVLDAVPDGYFFPRLYLFSPDWWDAQHPDDLVTFDPGDGKPRPFARDGKKRAPSWASKAWREDTAQAIRRYIEHVEKSPYADRVIGYHLASGTTEEWMMWGANENQWVDYSPVNVAAFRAWLTKRYANDEALRQAWNNKTVTLPTATIPPTSVRTRTLYGMLRDPAREQDVIDYTLYSSDLVAETIAYFAKVVKEATRRKKLVGVFYGYVLQLMGQRQQNAGHLALGKVLENSDVDFITSPTSYAFRAPGTGYSHFMSLTDSVKLHGKLWIDENDIRTWLTSGKAGDWGRTDTYVETLEQEQRELASVLGQGCGQWWFDMGGGWFDDSQMMEQIARQRRIADKTLRRPRGPVAEIAVVVDDKSLAYLRPGNPLSSPLMLQVLPHLARTGAPLSYYLLSDLPKAPRHKMVVFLNVFAPSAEERKAIDALKCDGRVLMFFWAAGLYRDGRIDPKAVSELTGMQIAVSDQREEMAGRFVMGSSLGRDLSGRSVGIEVAAGPSFSIDDAKAEILARDARGRGIVGLRATKTWTSVYSAVPVHSQPLFRKLAERARVHLYIDTPDVVYATESLIGIAFNQSGKRKVRLRRPARVWEAFSGRLVCNGVAEFTIDAGKHDTVLLRIEE
ncbi:MAG: beta-galactosidase [Phycisphaerae bacterium]|nr:beta-galactosidase [Phycisphaerae bacterium]